MSDKCPKCGAEMQRFLGPTGSTIELRHLVGDIGCLRRQLAAMTAERDGYKAIADAAAETLQPLLMDEIYDECAPVSHGWPGQSRVKCAVEAIREYRRQLAQANERNAQLDRSLEGRDCEIERQAGRIAELEVEAAGVVNGFTYRCPQCGQRYTIADNSNFATMKCTACNVEMALEPDRIAEGGLCWPGEGGGR